MTIERNVVDFKIHNLTEEQFQELKAQGKIDPSAIYVTPDKSANKSIDFETPVSETNKGATMKEIQDVVTSSLTFKGYVSTSAPNQNLVEGNLWINTSEMPTTFPVSVDYIQVWNGESWVPVEEEYTPEAFECFRNENDKEGYYWFAGEWVVLSTDLSTEFFVLNQTSGKWEIKPEYTNLFLGKSGGVMSGEIDCNGKPFRNPACVKFKPNSTSNGGYLDFHYAGSTEDYTSRIIEDASGHISVAAPNGIKLNGAEAATQTWVDSKFVVVDALPSSPDANTFYFVKE